MSAHVVMLSSEEWKQAVTEFAAWNHANSVADLIEKAVAHYARAEKYPKPIPRR